MHGFCMRFDNNPVVDKALALIEVLPQGIAIGNYASACAGVEDTGYVENKKWLYVNRSGDLRAVYQFILIKYLWMINQQANPPRFT
jgi:hypothetical protein